MEIPTASSEEPAPADPAASAAIWDWGSLLDVVIDDDDSLILPWGTPEDARPPPAAEMPPLPPPPAATPADGTNRVRKRDPRLICPKFLAGRVPCSCPEVDERAMEEEEVATGARKRARTGRASAGLRCQVPGCEVDISELKGYHKRHRVCLQCANASFVVVDGEHKRYCQQCGKFHVLPDFDEDKRSCRRKLERHNRRRRRRPNDSVNAVERETEAQEDSPAGVTCIGEPMKDTTKEFACNTHEIVGKERILGGEAQIEPEDGEGSPNGSLPSPKYHQQAASDEAQIDERITNSKSDLSSTYCQNKIAYSSVCPTGRISFKLYDWNPAEFPRRLRHQILQWLANMPVELEGYVRPGCTILTAFIAMPQFLWDKLTQDVAHHVRDLINAPKSLLLGRGAIFIYVSNTIIHVLQDGTTLANSKMEVKAPRLHYVYPFYFEAGKPMEFVACGSSLEQPKFRFLVSFAGKYVKHDSVRVISSAGSSYHYGNEVEINNSQHEMFRIRIMHMDSEVSGPAFIEVENVSGISNFIPILVGNKQLCSELERMEEVFTDSCYANSINSHNAISGPTPGSCELLTSKQAAISALLLDIAWLLKAPCLEEKELFWSLINIQRLISLLKFLIQNELFGVLQVIMHHLDNVIRTKGFDESDNQTSDLDKMLFDDYLNHAREILHQRTLHEMRSEVEPRNKSCGLLMPQSSFSKTDMCAMSHSNQDNKAITESLFSTPLQPAEEHDVNDPLVSKETAQRQRCYQNRGIKCSWEGIFSNKTMRTRLPLFVIVSVVLCLAACILLLHPHEAGEFAVSIRRCMFGGSAP